MPLNKQAREIIDGLNRDDYALMETYIDRARERLFDASVIAAKLKDGLEGSPPSIALSTALSIVGDAVEIAHRIQVRSDLAWKLRNIDANPTEGQ